jgi:hypothetical protein
VPKQSYWIADVEGNHALVEGADARDEWTKIRGWSEVGEPGPNDQVHVVNEHPEVGPGRLPYAALAAGLDGYGWRPGPPPPPFDATKDPALTDVAVPVVEPVKPKTPAAAGAAEKKE